jgi:hypothetical protein
LIKVSPLKVATCLPSFGEYYYSQFPTYNEEPGYEVAYSSKAASYIHIGTNNKADFN